MKKIFLCLFVVSMISPVSFAQFTKIGASAGYNYRYYFNNEPFSDHKLKNPIISVTSIYEINLPFHLSPRLNIYFPNINKEEFSPGNIQKTTTTGFSIDADAHYVINSLDQIEFYGLAGLNILYARRRYISEFDGTVEFEETSTNTALGLNVGAGAYLKIKDEFDLFFEAKAILSSQVQALATVGILLNMEYLWNREKDSGY